VRNLERSNDLLTAHGRERVKEVVNGITGFEVVYEVLDWHACTGEYGNAAQDFRVAVDYR